MIELFKIFIIRGCFRLKYFKVCFYLPSYFETLNTILQINSQHRFFFVNSLTILELFFNFILVLSTHERFRIYILIGFFISQF